MHKGNTLWHWTHRVFLCLPNCRDHGTLLLNTSNGWYRYRIWCCASRRQHWSWEYSSMMGGLVTAGIYFLRNFRFLRVTLLEPSTRMTYWSNWRTSMMDSCLIPFCGVLSNLILNSDNVPYF